jgi:hypothetical protein
MKFLLVDLYIGRRYKSAGMQALLGAAAVPEVWSQANTKKVKNVEQGTKTNTSN